MARLIYETTDSAFADRAVHAITKAAVSCYRTGPDIHSNIYVPSGEPRICLYISDEADYARANAILVKLGAATDTPPKLPPVWVLAIAAALIVALGYWVALQWT
jgi:hypothetical protein